MTGTVTKDINGDVVMKGDDGKNYYGDRSKFILLETEKRRMELEREVSFPNACLSLMMNHHNQNLLIQYLSIDATSYHSHHYSTN